MATRGIGHGLFECTSELTFGKCMFIWCIHKCSKLFSQSLARLATFVSTSLCQVQFATAIITTPLYHSQVHGTTFSHNSYCFINSNSTITSIKITIKHKTQDINYIWIRNDVFFCFHCPISYFGLNQSISLLWFYCANKLLEATGQLSFFIFLCKFFFSQVQSCICFIVYLVIRWRKLSSSNCYKVQILTLGWSLYLLTKWVVLKKIYILSRL